MSEILSIFLHIDTYIADVATQYGVLTYAILFVVIFLETGVVVTPFLPGDSLLFAVGALSALGVLSFPALIAVLTLAAILGDTVNYWIGARLGYRLLQKVPPRFLNPEHLARAERFYEEFGGYALISGRFIPIVRTFVPFVAGLARMNYGTFLLYNITGAVVWVLGIMGVGYFFGALPLVQENFGLAILLIVAVSFVPPALGVWRNWRSSTRTNS